MCRIWRFPTALNGTTRGPQMTSLDYSPVNIWPPSCAFWADSSWIKHTGSVQQEQESSQHTTWRPECGVDHLRWHLEELHWVWCCLCIIQEHMSLDNRVFSPQALIMSVHCPPVGTVRIILEWVRVHVTQKSAWGLFVGSWWTSAYLQFLFKYMHCVPQEVSI